MRKRSYHIIIREIDYVKELMDIEVEVSGKGLIVFFDKGVALFQPL